jgi:hydroxymethylglutaryl-CoA lyase/(R)-citramalyl-CoA lyase
MLAAIPTGGSMRITLCDVGPRDGLQNDPVQLEPAQRAELVDRLSATGLPRVEAVSFVNPKAVPRMAGAAEVMSGINRRPGVLYAGLILNGRGLDDAIAANVDEVHVAYPLTNTFCRKNQNVTLDEATVIGQQLVEGAKAAGKRVTMTLGVSFGCPFEGPVDPGLVVEHARLAVAAGADEVILADTIGVGVPTQIQQLVPATLAALAGTPVGLHLHNTRNTGYANAAAGLEAGATIFDASIGGLGGCPFAPRATGNIATEDLVYMLEGMGVETGVDLDELIRVSEWLGGVMGRDLPGLVHRAGPFIPVGTD